MNVSMILGKDWVDVVSAYQNMYRFSDGNVHSRTSGVGHAHFNQARV
jgi:hypothetical protein